MPAFYFSHSQFVYWILLLQFYFLVREDSFQFEHAVYMQRKDNSQGESEKGLSVYK